MRKIEITSRCSSGSPVKFNWFSEFDAKPGSDLHAALDAFEGAYIKENRLINDYLLASARADIRTTLMKAMRGDLLPIKQLKALNGRVMPQLFEIRWQNITAREIQQNGTLKTVQLLFRMYHSEPSEVPGYFIGHHIHEKQVKIREDIKQLQNREIQRAREYFESGRQSHWGINELTE